MPTPPSRGRAGRPSRYSPTRKISGSCRPSTKAAALLAGSDRRESVYWPSRLRNHARTRLVQPRREDAVRPPSIWRTAGEEGPVSRPALRDLDCPAREILAAAQTPASHSSGCHSAACFPVGDASVLGARLRTLDPAEGLDPVSDGGLPGVLRSSRSAGSPVLAPGRLLGHRLRTWRGRRGDRLERGPGRVEGSRFDGHRQPGGRGVVGGPRRVEAQPRCRRGGRTRSVAGRHGVRPEPSEPGRPSRDHHREEDEHDQPQDRQRRSDRRGCRCQRRAVRWPGQPVGEAHVLAHVRWARRREARAGAAVDQPRDPRVIARCWAVRLRVQPGQRPSECARALGPRRIAAARKQLGLERCPLERLPDVVLAERRPAEPSTSALIVGSSGYLEIAANQTSAASLIGCSAGAPVELDLY